MVCRTSSGSCQPLLTLLNKGRDIGNHLFRLIPGRALLILHVQSLHLGNSHLCRNIFPVKIRIGIGKALLYLLSGFHVIADGCVKIQNLLFFHLLYHSGLRLFQRKLCGRDHLYEKSGLIVMKGIQSIRTFLIGKVHLIHTPVPCKRGKDPVQITAGFYKLTVRYPALFLLLDRL